MTTKQVTFTLLVAGIALVVLSKQGLLGANSEDSFPKMPADPPESVSSQFEGEWAGRRFDETNNNLCERTTITGKVVDGLLSMTLTYNGTPLKGWIEESGNIVMYANNRQWDYRFTGQAWGNKIQGRWHLTNGPCKGSWALERKNPQ